MQAQEPSSPNPNLFEFSDLSEPDDENEVRMKKVPVAATQATQEAGGGGGGTTGLTNLNVATFEQDHRVKMQTHDTATATATTTNGDKKSSPNAGANPFEVIELLDDDDDSNSNDDFEKGDQDEVDTPQLEQQPHQQQQEQEQQEQFPAEAVYSKRQKLTHSDGSSAMVNGNHRPLVAPPRLTTTTTSTSTNTTSTCTSTSIIPPLDPSSSINHIHHSNNDLDQPEYLSFPANFQPSWMQLLPVPVPVPVPPAQTTRALPLQPLQVHAAAAPTATTSNNHHHNKPRQKYFKLSLLNINEFTITGLPVSYDSPPTSIAGLRVPIRKISREHGKAVFERDKDENGNNNNNDDNNNHNHNYDSNTGTCRGKWRIPLGAYQSFFTWLTSDPYTRVDGIPPHQLQIASLERARQEKGYPSEETLIQKGVPPVVAKALAPFQRGGVDFVIEKGGRALIADDMGLGKTIQGIASMAVYRDEWPLLVLCPSSARYHWESEFQRWLGVESSSSANADANTASDQRDEKTGHDGGEAKMDDIGGAAAAVAPLENWQINVLSSSRGPILPFPDTKVVICSYGLAPALAQMGKISAQNFGAAIVDESHMLKNKASKRTKLLLPILRSINRCVLLSGTPALARPVELWPQLDILRVTQQHEWWEDEADFINKYVKHAGPMEKAELHTMLTGTVMIRRLKNDILKDLPRKLRSKAVLHVLAPDQVTEFKGLLAQLRQGKGALGEIARSQHAAVFGTTDEEEVEEVAEAAIFNSSAKDSSPNNARVDAEKDLLAEMSRRLHEGQFRIHKSLAASALASNLEQRNNALLHMQGDLQAYLDKEYMDRAAALDAQYGVLPNSRPSSVVGDGEEVKRTALLSHMYSLTGDVKIPVVVDMLQRWLRDPTKGKLCIFAHHLSVLNAISDQAGLSNDPGSTRRYIRIDGSTMPKQRQEQIKVFQTDPSVRVALLGITAAGVAVTLVASSTVWFAELFWTPALMIQAEDRCHRIGQQARVTCLYFVAKGTLDEVLWKLIEKKFQDLGEFVEGKEKLQLVVEKIYQNEKELHSIFESLDDMDDVNNWFDDETGFDNDLTFDDFADDIARLGQEECDMLRIDSDEDEDADAVPPSEVSSDKKVSAITPSSASNGLGRTEDEAIVLDDDDDDDDDEEGKDASQKVATHAGESSTAINTGVVSVPNGLSTSPVALQGCRIYKIRMATQKLGLELSLYKGRAIVAEVTKDRLERVGVEGKPAVGDIVVAVNGMLLPPAQTIGQVVGCIRSAMLHPPLELTCAEYPIFIQEFHNVLESRTRQLAERNRSAAENVIDLIDDDD